MIVQAGPAGRGLRGMRRHTPAMIRTALCLLLSIAAILAAVETTLTPVDYTQGGTALRGVLALPVGAKPTAGVLVVPEWWGMNDYAQRRARELAEHGYAEFACDMYGVGKVN